MNYTYYIADVFTDQPFQGVPLAVFTDSDGLSTNNMQQLAGELNASNTVFLQPTKDQNNYQIKVFSKFQELPIGAHSILAASYVLAKTGQVALSEQHTLISLESQWNKHQQTINTFVSKNQIGETSLIQQTYHTRAEVDYYTPTKEELAAMLSLKPEDIGFDNYRPLIVSCTQPYLIIPVKSYRAIRQAKFNESIWSETSAPSSLAQEIFLFSNNTDDTPADFHTRLLGPAIAHHEDPPIGSAIGVFANYLCNHTNIQVGTHVFAIQRGANEARKSLFYIEMDNNKSQELTIRVGGYAALTSEAKITIN